MTAEIEKPKFSLWDIEAALSDLLTMRAEAEEIAEPAEREQALAGVDQALREYVGRELQKVDSIIGFCRTLKRAQEAAKEDRDYYARRAGFLERTLARVKDFAHTAMESAGKKRLDGRAGYLLVKGNGGIEPLVIDEKLLPLEYRSITVRLPQPLYDELLYGQAMVETISSEPDNRRIRTALVQPCPVCAGDTVFAIGRPENATETCAACGGTGRNAVPGAHLEPRGAHVEVK